MRPTYSAALRDMLDDVVNSTPRNASAPSGLRVRPQAFRTAATSLLVAAGVIGLTTVVLLHASPSRPGPPASAPDPAPTDTATPPPAPLVYLGLVHFSSPEATSNPTSTIYIGEDWDPLRNVPGTCGIALAKESAAVDPGGVVTITVRGYGYSSAPDGVCGLPLVSPGPVEVRLRRTIDVAAVIDGATHKKTPLASTSHAGQLKLIDGSGRTQWLPRTPAP